MLCACRYLAELKEHKAVQGRLDEAKKALEQARHAITERGRQAAALKEMEDIMVQEREKRIEHTSQMAARRIAKRGVTRGWLAWQGVFIVHARMLRMLKSAGGRLARPRLASAMQHWHKVWENTELDAQMRKMDAQLRASQASDVAVKEEMQRQLEERLAAERQSRIEHTTQMAVRRIGKRDLTRGWVAWHDGYVDETRVRRMLGRAAAKLLKPKLVSAVQHWKDDFTSAQ